MHSTMAYVSIPPAPTASTSNHLQASSPQPYNPHLHTTTTTTTGPQNMDSHAILLSGPPHHVPYWNDCIPIQSLSKDNLPPYHRRLRNDQVGHLLAWMAAENKQDVLAAMKANQYWPLDITKKGEARSTREKWGRAYDGRGGFGLKEGPTLPVYEDQKLPPTGTRNGKLMIREPGFGLGGSRTGNRRASDESAGADEGGAAKRSCAGAGRDEVRKALTERLDTLGERNDGLREKLGSLETEIKERDTEKEAHMQEVATAKCEKETLRLEAVRLKDENSMHVQAIAILENGRERQRQEIAKQKDQLNDLESTGRAREAKAMKVEQRLNSDLDATTSRCKLATQKIRYRDEKIAQLERVEGGVYSIKARLEVAKKDVSDYANELENLKARLEASEETVRVQAQDLRGLMTSLDDAIKQRNEHADQLSRIRTVSAVAHEANKRLGEEIGAMSTAGSGPPTPVTPGVEFSHYAQRGGD